METPKLVVLLLNGTQYLGLGEAKKMAVLSLQGQNRAVHSMQGGGGVTLINAFPVYGLIKC